MSDYVYLWESFSDIKDEVWDKIDWSQGKQTELPKVEEPDVVFERNFEKIDWGTKE